MVLAFCSVFYVNFFFFEETVRKIARQRKNSADEIQQSENPTRERRSCLAFAGCVERAKNDDLTRLCVCAEYAESTKLQDKKCVKEAPCT